MWPHPSCHHPSHLHHSHPGCRQEPGSAFDGDGQIKRDHQDHWGMPLRMDRKLQTPNIGQPFLHVSGWALRCPGFPQGTCQCAHICPSCCDRLSQSKFKREGKHSAYILLNHYICEMWKRLYVNVSDDPHNWSVSWCVLPCASCGCSRQQLPWSASWARAAWQCRAGVRMPLWELPIVVELENE